MSEEFLTIDKSDEEFLTRLKEIQPYLSALKSEDYEIQSCRKWLHKLYKTSRRHIPLRNIYLAELLKQLKNGKLKEPFNTLPKDHESLLPLTTYLPIQKYNDLNTGKDALAQMLKCTNATVIMFHKSYTENHENFNEQIKEIDKDESIINDKILDFDDNISEESQLQNTITYNSEGGDGISINYETRANLESIEKLNDELKIKNEKLTDQVQIYADKNNLSNSQMNIFNDELNKVKNNVEKICNQNEIDIEKTAEIDKRVEQVLLVVNSLKPIVDDVSEHKRILNDIMELLHHLKEQHCLQIIKNQKNFDEQINKYEREIEQLKACVNIKAEEADGLNKRVNQRLHVESLKKKNTRVEEYMDEKLSKLVPYITQLETINNQLGITNENQRKIILALNEKMDKINEPLKTKEIQDFIDNMTKT